MLREMETWSFGKFRRNYERACACSDLFTLKLVYRTSKAGELRMIHGRITAGASLNTGFFPCIRRSVEDAALAVAAAENRYALVRLLIHQGVDVQGAYPALSCYAPVDRPRHIRQKVLLQADRDPDPVPRPAWATPLYASAEWGGDERTMRYLLQSGACPNSRSYDRDRTALFGVVRSLPRRGEDSSRHRSGILSRINLLLQYGADPNAIAEGGETVIVCAADRGYTDVMELLLDNAPGLIFGVYENLTLLQRTSAGSHFEATRMLLERRMINVNHAGYGQSIQRYPALSRALLQDNYIPLRSQVSHITTVKTLLDHGADPDGTNQMIPPLILAIDHNEPEIARMLLEAGADVGRRDRARGWTPLESCIMGVLLGHVELHILELLLRFNADHRELFSSGHTALTKTILAPSGQGRNWRKRMTLQILLNNGADVGQRTRDGVSTLEAVDIRSQPSEEKQCIVEILRPYSKGELYERFNKRSKELLRRRQRRVTNSPFTVV